MRAAIGEFLVAYRNALRFGESPHYLMGYRERENRGTSGSWKRGPTSAEFEQPVYLALSDGGADGDGALRQLNRRLTDDTSSSASIFDSIRRHRVFKTGWHVKNGRPAARLGPCFNCASGFTRFEHRRPNRAR